MKRLFKTFTDEERAKYRKKRIEERSKLSLAYQLGYYVGEQIVNRFLPTLSVDDIHTRKVIPTTNEEEIECKRLQDIWFAKRMESRNDDDHKSSEEEWKALRAYHEMLELKYLSETIKCNFGLLNVTEQDMVEFKLGVGVSLWDCDCSHYSCKPENIDVKADDDGMFTVITLKRE